MSAQDLVATLSTIVGRRRVLTGAKATRRYTIGYRFGGGPVLAAVIPGSLLEQWRVIQACVSAGVVVIVQAANTGLTGGSTPDGNDYGRDVVIVNTLRINHIQLIKGGRQVICLAGATLYGLEAALAPIGREPHSVIGSSCFGASVVGGVCNNSGGALVRRGPAYTELALFARLEVDGTLSLVNHLGVNLGTDPEAMLRRLESSGYSDEDIVDDPARAASDRDYADHVRDYEASTPARFNADSRRLHEAAGCAGRLIVFAVRLDTFPKEPDTRVFYIGTNDPTELTELRRVILGQFAALPIAGEYMHRDAFDMAAVYGKDLFLAVRLLGTRRLPLLFSIKGRLDALGSSVGLGSSMSDRLLQWAAGLFPEHLPERMTDYRDRFEHHLILRISGSGIKEARNHLASVFPSGSGDWFECTRNEGDKAFLHRFAAAGAAVRYRAMHRREVEDIVALDIALPRNASEWFERLPSHLDALISHKLYYGHFLCYVLHQDYIVAKGQDVLAIEHMMWDVLDLRGAEYPAEHNVGHLYPAKSNLQKFYRELDPCNQLNPGIGQTSKRPAWK
jgi:D-lactate dehydrogenase